MRVIYRVLYFVFVFLSNVSMLCYGAKDDRISNQMQGKKSFSTSFFNDRSRIFETDTYTDTEPEPEPEPEIETDTDTETEGVYRVSSNSIWPVSNSQKKMQYLSGLSPTILNFKTLNEHNRRFLDSEDQSSRVLKWLDQQQNYSLGQEQFFRDSTLKSIVHSIYDGESFDADASSAKPSSQTTYIAPTDKGSSNALDRASGNHSDEIMRVKVSVGFLPSLAKALVMTVEKGNNGQYYRVDGKCCLQKSTKKRNGGLENANFERTTKARSESFVKAIHMGIY